MASLQQIQSRRKAVKNARLLARQVGQITKAMEVVAYIDGANLHNGSKSLGWVLDYRKFRVWLKEKFNVTRAYIFIGLVPRYKDLYAQLQEDGYILIYKEVTYDGTGKIKGNCDADLVLKAVVDFYEKQCEQAILVSNDGDYAPLVKFLQEKNAFHSLISPSNKCSYLLRKLNTSIVFLDTQRSNIELLPEKEKALDGDETP